MFILCMCPAYFFDVVQTIFAIGGMKIIFGHMVCCISRELKLESFECIHVLRERSQEASSEKRSHLA